MRLSEYSAIRTDTDIAGQMDKRPNRVQSKYAGKRIIRGLTAVARAGALWRRMARAEKLHFRQTGRIFAAGNPPQGDNVGKSHDFPPSTGPAAGFISTR